MHPEAILLIFGLYTVFLFVIAWFTSRRSTNETYFIGNRASPWYVVAYGMIGASLSGVTFISIPGDVGNSAFSYMVIVFGYLVGYLVIALVLLPLYYRLNLTTIYSYLKSRFGFWSHKTGAFYFLLSRSIGASFRVYLVVNVLQRFVFDAWNIPFAVTVLIFMGLIILYSYKGGIKTIVWTDTLQTTFMLAAVVFTVFLIQRELGIGFAELFDRITSSRYSQMIFTDVNHPRYFLKQFLSGAFIAIVMTGLDQDMMQKNLSCKTLRDSQKNMITMSWLLVPVNLLFLSLGVVLYIFVETRAIPIPSSTDELFPLIAFRYLSPLAGIVFLIGLVAAAYSSADGAITSLSTSFIIDILGKNNQNTSTKSKNVQMRYVVHFSVAAALILLVVIFRYVSDQSVIQKLFTIAGYTYGPLLGLFAFGLFTRWQVNDRLVPLVALISPALSYMLSIYSRQLLWGYVFGFELLILNGMFTFAGLYIIKTKPLE